MANVCSMVGSNGLLPSGHRQRLKVAPNIGRKIRTAIELLIKQISTRE